MLAPPSGLLRAGLAVKFGQIKLATRSYMRDRTRQATGTVTSYAAAAGLFAAAGVFLIAACLVGATALFRWIEINYGLFQAFGVVGGLLVAIAGLCAGLATSRLKRPPPRFPGLASRLRVAVKANPLQPTQLESASDTAAAILSAPSTPITTAYRRPSRVGRPPRRGNGAVRAGLLITAALVGWAATRRRQQARRAAS
jgi:hypothetical protein